MKKTRTMRAGLSVALSLIIGFALGEFFPLTFMKDMKLGATDFGMDLDEGIKKEEAFVLKGEIDLTKKDKDGNEKKIKVGKGQKANAFDDDFKPIEIPPAELVKLEDELHFKKLKTKGSE